MGRKNTSGRGKSVKTRSGKAGGGRGFQGNSTPRAFSTNDEGRERPFREYKARSSYPLAGLGPPTAPKPATNLQEFLQQHPFELFNLRQLRTHLELMLGRIPTDDELYAELNRLAAAGLADERQGRWRARLVGQEFEGPIRFYWKDNYAEVTTGQLTEPIVLVDARGLECLPEDVVRVSIERASGGKLYGELVEVVRVAREVFVGTLEYGGATNWFHPQDAFLRTEFGIPNNKLMGAQHGQKVRARVTGFRNGRPRAEVIEILGNSGQHEVEIHAIISEYRLPTEFSEGALRDAEAIPDAIPAEEIARRRDFRGIPTFTIDPVDAKDFDDALSFEALPDGTFRIGVHIADVSHYLKPGTALDADAYARATSVYLVDRTLPMLPEKLSNHLCSLVPHQDRLAYAAVFVLHPNGQVQEEWFGRTVIHSTRRFSYEEVQAILYAGHGEHFAELNTLNQIAHQLREQRFARGSIGFETDEVRFRLDAEGRPLELYVKERFDAHKLIEDFMLLANRRVAALVARKRPPVPFPYRVHPTPLPEKLAALQDFVARFGHTLHLPDTEPQTVADALNKLTAAVQGRPEQNIVQSMSIRSMPKAIYTTDNDGHYGLGFADYCHFTSPIRRYPDVLAHRILTDVLENRPSLGKSVLEEMCKHSSEREKVAADAERASIRFKMAEYMQQRIGQVLQGAISGITDWGLYIELRESKIEGMAWVSELPGDRWQPDDKLHYLEGLHTRQRLYLGDVVHVRVRAANPLKRQIDFEVLGKVDTSETPPPPRPTDTPARPAGASPSGFWAPVFKPGTGGKPIKQKGGRGGPPRPPTDGSGPPKKRGSSKPKRGR